MDCSPRTAFPNAFVSFLCEAYEEILFTLHLSLGIPCVYRHSRRWRVFGHSSPTLHHSSPLCFDGFAYLLTPRCLVPWWRVVKSGWRVADNSSPLETPCLSAFQGIRWRVSDGIGLSPDCRPAVGAFRSIMLAGFDFYCFSSVLSCWMYVFVWKLQYFIVTLYGYKECPKSSTGVVERTWI